MTHWIEKKSGKIYIESLIARGGMAEVYAGMPTSLQGKGAGSLATIPGILGASKVEK